MQRRIVSGLFRSRAAADNAIDAVLSVGYTGRDVGVVMSDQTHRAAVDETTGTQAAAGAGIGGAVGGTLGAVLGAIVAVGSSFVVPGLGLVVAGPIAAALAGAGAGGAAGGLVGALVGAGIPEHHARDYAAGLERGGILLTVEPRTDADADMLARLMENAGAVSVRHQMAERTVEEV
ncbi:MAG: hypothetical protein ACOZNI_35485 [Myxococcota bacterium]